MSAPAPSPVGTGLGVRPNLNSQPNDVLGIISRSMGFTQTSNLAPVSKRLQDYNNNKDRLKKQRQQWQLMMQGALTDNFGANETLIRSHGGKTFEFHAGTYALLNEASQSLTNPPPELEESERERLVQAYLPTLYSLEHGNLSRYLEIDARARIGRALKLTSINVPSQSLCKNYLAVEGFQLNEFLELFTKDSFRFSDENGVKSLATLLLEYAIPYNADKSLDKTGTLGRDKVLLALSFVLRGGGVEQMRHVNIEARHVQHPGILRTLILSGFNPFIGPNKPLAFFGERMITTSYFGLLLRESHNFGREVHPFGTNNRIQDEENQLTLDRAVLSAQILIQQAPEDECRRRAVTYFDDLMRNPVSSLREKNRWVLVLTRAITDAFLARFPDLASYDQ